MSSRSDQTPKSRNAEQSPTAEASFEAADGARALAPAPPAEGEDPNARRPGFNPAVAGKRAECDGGGLGPGGRYIQRQDFTGTLTGEYYDQGDPPWRWYLLTELTDKPDGFPFEAVWCESESLFLIHDRPPVGSGRIT